MKKTYLIPEMLMVRVASQRMISASGDLQLAGDDYTGKLGSSFAETDGLSKRYSVWDDDWSGSEE